MLLVITRFVITSELLKMSVLKILHRDEGNKNVSCFVDCQINIINYNKSNKNKIKQNTILSIPNHSPRF